MQTKINVNYRRLFQATMISLCWCAFLFGGAYVGYLFLSVIFWNLPVFASLFGLAVSVGAFLTYDGGSYQWDNHPRVVIKKITEVLDDDE
jgi:hypothetical protein